MLIILTCGKFYIIIENKGRLRKLLIWSLPVCLIQGRAFYMCSLMKSWPWEEGPVNICILQMEKQRHRHRLVHRHTANKQQIQDLNAELIPKCVFMERGPISLFQSNAYLLIFLLYMRNQTTEEKEEKPALSPSWPWFCSRGNNAMLH